MLTSQKHLTVLVLTNSVTNYYPMLLTAICIACWKIFLLIDRSVQEFATPVNTNIKLSSGVIQGSCLGPLLFILYTNDIVQLFDGLCDCKLYADDLKL